MILTLLFNPIHPMIQKEAFTEAPTIKEADIYCVFFLCFFWMKPLVEVYSK